MIRMYFLSAVAVVLSVTGAAGVKAQGMYPPAPVEQVSSQAEGRKQTEKIAPGIMPIKPSEAQMVEKALRAKIRSNNLRSGNHELATINGYRLVAVVKNNRAIGLQMQDAKGNVVPARLEKTVTHKKQTGQTIGPGPDFCFHFLVERCGEWTFPPLGPPVCTKVVYDPIVICFRMPKGTS
jgi:hypothetical protein